MPTLQIHDLEPQHAAVVDPRLVLPMLGERAIQVSWQVAGVAHFNEPIFAMGELENVAQRLPSVSGM